MKRRNFLAAGLLANLDITSYTQPFLVQPNIEIKDPLEPVYIPPSQEPLKVQRGSRQGFRTKMRSNQTNMQYSCIEGIIEGKTMGPAPHLHKELDEIMFVQQGVVSVLVGNKVCEVEAGGWHLRPHGIVHTFWNAHDKPACFIDMYFNQDFENFLEEMFFEIDS